MTVRIPRKNKCRKIRLWANSIFLLVQIFNDSHRRSVNSVSGFYFRLFVNFLSKYTYPFQWRPIGITLFGVNECPFRYNLTILLYFIGQDEVYQGKHQYRSD